MEYRYYFGTYDSDIELSMEHTESTTTGDITVPKNITLRPWELKHVKEISEGMSTTSSTIGIPDKPSECVYIFDTGGPVRTFTVTGTRYDHEEQVSNLDFIHTQFNRMTEPKSCFRPFKADEIENLEFYSVGIEWLTSTMQSTMKGYLFRKVADELVPDERIPVKDLGNGQNGEDFNVGLTSFSYSFDNDNPGIMNYTLTFTERKMYEYGPIYREYVPSVKRVE